MPRKTKDQKDIKNEKITTKTNKKIKEIDNINPKSNDVQQNSKKQLPKTKSITKSVSKKQPAKTKSATKSVSKKQPAKTKSTTTTRKSTKKAVASNSNFADIIEYYDLPYRYNQTIVKLLAQTPNTLFIYWDISDVDRENLKQQYGFDFFHKTRPILIIHNDTMNYSFEIEIDDFANSWYLHVNDSNCNYRIELGRKFIPEYEEIPSFQNFTYEEIIEIDKFPPKTVNKDYFYITTSNSLISPNDHILMDSLNSLNIQVRNVKTNKQYNKSFSSLVLKNNMNNYSIYELYKKLYKEENIEDIFDLSNPSSGNPSSRSFSSQFK